MRGQKPNGFTLDPNSGEFVLTHSNLTTPVSRTIYSINEGNYKTWHEHVQKYVTSLKEGQKTYSHRYGKSNL